MYSCASVLQPIFLLGLKFFKEQIDTEKLIKRVNRPTEAIKKVIEKLERASDREKPTNVFMKELNIPAHLSDE